jgi:DNA polymerase elongation subunit (family B)
MNKYLGSSFNDYLLEEAKAVSKPKILFYDIETAPNLAYVWGMYEQNVLSYKEEWSLLSFAWKWQDGPPVACLTRQDFKDKTDKSLLKALWKLLNEADIVVAHNGDQFDNKKANARFIAMGFPPVKPYRSVDTKKVAKAHFNFNSNSLDNLGKTLKLGQKAKHEGFELWLGCMANKVSSWKNMIHYNKQDVVLLEKIYNKMLPWINNHPSISKITGRPDGCPKCGSSRLHSRGMRHYSISSFRVYQCKDCKGYVRMRLAEKGNKPKFVNL